MYATCLRCERALGTNAELPHLPVGRRVAFDVATGRLWVVCTRCGQWILTPLEERWEALAECERLAADAEARVSAPASGGALGLARTAAGLELLRVGGLAREDIANWRYGRRARVRQRRAVGALVALAVVALALGFGAGRLAGAPFVTGWVAVLLGTLFLHVWRRPPRLWLRVPDGEGRFYLLWPWHHGEIHLVAAPGRGAPLLYVPHARGRAWLRGPRAAAALAGLLPKLNRTDSADADVGRAVPRAAAPAPARVSDAGGAVVRGAPKRARVRGPGVPESSPESSAEFSAGPWRPWERLVGDRPSTRVSAMTPEERLALEMAVTEEMERGALRDRAAALVPRWRDEEEVGAIADALLVPEPVADRLAVLRARPAERPEEPAAEAAAVRSGQAGSAPAPGREVT